jgi:hypothetical protein
MQRVFINYFKKNKTKEEHIHFLLKENKKKREINIFLIFNIKLQNYLYTKKIIIKKMMLKKIFHSSALN